MQQIKRVFARACTILSAAALGFGGAGHAATVTSYGATGNDASDDTTAIQNCLNANTDVQFPAGTYYVNQALSVPNANTTIYGVIGSETSVTIVVNHAGDGIDVGPRDGVTIRDLTMDRASANASNGRMIVSSSSEDLLVNNVRFLDNRGQAPVVFADSCVNPRVWYCYVRNYGWQVSGYVYGVGIRFSDCDDGEIKYNDVIENQNLIVSNPPGNFYQAAGIEFSGGSYIECENNYVYRSGNGIDAGNADHCDVLFNTIEDCYYTSVKLVNGSHGINVKWNTLDKAGLANVWLNPGSPSAITGPCYSNTIHENVITGTGKGMGENAFNTTFRPSGILLDGHNSDSNLVSRYNTITSNEVYDTDKLKYGWVEDTSLTYDPYSNTFSNNQLY